MIYEWQTVSYVSGCRQWYWTHPRAHCLHVVRLHIEFHQSQWKQHLERFFSSCWLLVILKKTFETGSATEVRPDTFTVYSTNAVSMQYVQSCTFLLLKLSFQRKKLALPKSENILIKLIDSSPVTHPWPKKSQSHSSEYIIFSIGWHVSRPLFTTGFPPPLAAPLLYCKL